MGVFDGAESNGAIVQVRRGLLVVLGQVPLSGRLVPGVLKPKVCPSTSNMGVLSE